MLKEQAMAGENQQDGQDTRNQLASRRRTATDAEMLIEHASRAGVRIEDTIMQRILQWVQRVRSSVPITVEDDVAFWEAYQSINAAVLPANVDSIRERLNFGDTDQRSNLEIASSKSRQALISILVITLIVHCYFAVLQNVISDAQTAQTDFANAKISLTATDDPSHSSLQDAAEQMRAAGCIWHSNLQLLGYWLFVDDVVHFFLRTDSSGSNAAARPDESGACTLRTDLTDRDNLLSVPLEHRGKLANDAALLTRAISTRNAVSQFVLPLLYGWLGALAYGLRTFASELRSVTFSRATHIEQKMRIPLGILAGATVGLLIQPETLNTIQGVTSIGIAFGLGFSVDLFFDLLEGMMARLRGTSAVQAASPIVSLPPSPPAQAASPIVSPPPSPQDINAELRETLKQGDSVNPVYLRGLLERAAQIEGAMQLPDHLVLRLRSWGKLYNKAQNLKEDQASILQNAIRDLQALERVSHAWSGDSEKAKKQIQELLTSDNSIPEDLKVFNHDRLFQEYGIKPTAHQSGTKPPDKLANAKDALGKALKTGGLAVAELNQKLVGLTDEDQKDPELAGLAVRALCRWVELNGPSIDEQKRAEQLSKARDALKCVTDSSARAALLEDPYVKPFASELSLP